MASCFRPESPFLQGQSRTKEMLTDGDNKIHRIMLSSEAYCILAHVDSPDCIWFKLENHISEQLRICKPEIYSMEAYKKEQPEDFDYVMAPIEEGVYARARVVCKKAVNEQIYAYVHFIDEGYGVWMNTLCLAKMDLKWYAHPWQAFPVALFKLSKERTVWMESGQVGTGKWPDGLREELVRIMDEYPLFKVEPAIGRITALNDYNEYIRANVFGMSVLKDEKGSRWECEDSIAHLLALYSTVQNDLVFPILDRKMYSAHSLKLERPAKDSIALMKAELDQMPNWRRSFPVKPAGIPAEQLDHGTIASPKSWTKRPKNLPVLTMEWLLHHCGSPKFPNRVQLVLDWRTLKSPYEFFGFPLRTVSPDASDDQQSASKMNPIRALFEEEKKLASELGAFYRIPENRRPHLPAEIGANLSRNQPVFAIYKVCGEELRNSGTFQRVQVLAVRKMRIPDLAMEFCRIRYLDVGGHEVVPLVSLLRMHPNHYAIPPLCIQLCLESVRPPTLAHSWTPGECTHFKGMIRVDKVAHCELLPLMLNGQLADDYEINACRNYEAAPEEWPGTFYASSLSIGDEDIGMKMVGGGVAVLSRGD